MPLRVTNFSWTQTDSMVCITVPLKGIRVGNVDIISTDEYLKVHYPPNLFEAFLFEPVDDARSTVQFGNGAAVICLPKRTNKVWEHLMISPRGKCAQKSEKKHVHLPDPRPTGIIQVSFTSRVFPTALRESRMPEEEEWLNREAEARRAVKADIEDLKDLTEVERYTDCFKDKGDKCYAAGDYLGAVNSYSLAIRLNRKIPALYSNRAVCHLKLRNFHKAIDDSSQALDLLTPPVDNNAAARVKAHVRRGSALCHLQLYAEGLQDYQKALQIDRYNEALQADTQRIRNIIQNTAATQKMDQT
uniref:Dynein axonemal assembly factor 4 n=1 Tax=Mola mola TaxID=94237 RepID=A0A3Q3VLT0_MOLML